MADGVVQVVADDRGRERGRPEAPDLPVAPVDPADPPALGAAPDAARPSDADPAPGGEAAAGGLPLPALLVVTALAAAAFGQGAFYRSGQWAVAGLLATVAALLLARPSWPDRTHRPLLALAACLAGWAVVSAVAAGEAGAALGTVLVVAGAVVVVLAGHRLDRPGRDEMAAALVGLGVAVAVTGWAGVAWRRPPWALQDQGLWRAATTLTYANAAAGFLAAVALLALARATAAPRSVVAALGSCVLLTTLGATLSRGGGIAFLAGALVLARLLGAGAVLRAAAPPVLGSLVALAGLWPSIPASAPARPALAVAGLAAGLLVAAGATRLRSRTLVLLVLAGLVAAAAVAAGPQREASRRITAPRLTLASSDRVGEARAALDMAAGRPVLGAGPGRAVLRWVRPDGAVLTARYAHNEYLQVLAELGVVGLGLLLGLLAAIGRGLRRCRRSAAPRSTWAGGAAGLAALGVHGLFDFGWHLPAIALTGALLVGIATTKEKEAGS